jgi:hypothetical protein
VAVDVTVDEEAALLLDAGCRRSAGSDPPDCRAGAEEEPRDRPGAVVAAPFDVPAPPPRR